MPGMGVSLRRCSLRLGGRRVLDEFDLQISPGEKWLLIGANGAGKTQLVKLIAGLRWPTASGRERRVYTDGQGQALDLVEARGRIAYVGAESQDRYVRYGWNHSLEQVVATGLFNTDIPLDVPDPAGRRRVRALLRRFGLDDVAAARMLEASYGQRRLALVARALAARPRLLLLDEVFNGLDGGHRRLLARSLAATLRSGMTLVVTAHRAEDVPRGISRVALVDGGALREISLRRALRSIRCGALPGRTRRVTADRGRRLLRPHVELRDVCVFREGRRVLVNVNWTLCDGDHWAVTGPNGSGKSSLLGVLYGALPVALGGAVVRREHPQGTPLDEIRRDIAIVSPELQAEYDASSTLEEVVVSGLRGSVGLDRPPTRAERAAARKALDSIGLLAAARRRPREVSYGELRLALFARAFVRRPRMLLLDEPFTGLDPTRRRRLRDVLSRLAETGTRLVIAVHHRDDLPPEVNRHLQLKRGRASVTGARWRPA
jgi:molybdate transport system ATP-binding protein